MNPTPPNGGFLAAWGPDGTWDGSPAVYQGSAPLAQPGAAALPSVLPQNGTLGGGNNPADFQTAGGSGGGFTNFSSWLMANPTVATQNVAQAQQDPKLNTQLAKPDPNAAKNKALALMQGVTTGAGAGR